MFRSELASQPGIAFPLTVSTISDRRCAGTMPQEAMSWSTYTMPGGNDHEDT